MWAVALLGLTLIGMAVPAAAISVQNGADLFTAHSLVAPGAFSGVVGFEVQSNAGLAASCTGALIGSNTLLTAAHCLTLDGSGIKATRAVFGDLTLPLGTTIAGNKVYLLPGWNGSVSHGSDLAIVKLDRKAPTGTTLYKVDTGSVTTNFAIEQLVGLGSVATGAFGPLGFDGRKRFGYNQYQFTFDQVLAGAGFGTASTLPSDIFGSPKGSELAYDFNDGNPLHDVFGRYLGSPGLSSFKVSGVTYGATSATPGDSGAPHFERGRIVGITSFGISGSLFEHGACGTSGSVAPSCAPATFGTIGVDTRVGAFAGFVAGHVPEPASWTLLIAGFGAIGIGLRRQRRLLTRRI